MQNEKLDQFTKELDEHIANMTDEDWEKYFPSPVYVDNVKILDDKQILDFIEKNMPDLVSSGEFSFCDDGQSGWYDGENNIHYEFKSLREMISFFIHQKNYEYKE